MGAVLSKGHIFQFFGENYTTALALKFSSYISDHKQPRKAAQIVWWVGKNPQWTPRFCSDHVGSNATISVFLPYPQIIKATITSTRKKL